MRRRAAALAAAGLLLLLCPGRAHAVFDLIGTRSLAVGGALRAAPTAESSLLLNPAGLTLTKSYVLNALYQFRVSDSASMVNASVVDSATTSVAAGLFYSYSHASPSFHMPDATKPGEPYPVETTIDSHEAGLSLAYNLWSFLNLGLTTRYVHYERMMEEGTPEQFTDEETIDTVTLDAGAILSPFSGLQLAVVGYNLVPVGSLTFPIELGLGASYTIGTFLLSFDAVLDFSRGEIQDETVTAYFGGGAEVFLGNLVALRGGAAHDLLKEATYVTAGVGVVTTQVAIDAGLRQMVDGGVETMLAFSIRLFLM